MRIYLFSFLFFSIGIIAQTVYTTPSGSKYHLSSCSSVKNVSSARSLENAQRNGFSPCKVCKPPYNPRTIPTGNPPKKVPGTNSKNRCYAVTKKGTRCSRSTEIGNDYCFQHLR